MIAIRDGCGEMCWNGAADHRQPVDDRRMTMATEYGPGAGEPAKPRSL